LGLQGKSLPDRVHREFETYLKCGRLEHGSLRVRCDECHFDRLEPPPRTQTLFAEHSHDRGKGALCQCA
jgi:hypothetical protein